MVFVRRLLLQRSLVAAMIVVAALAMRMLVPGGFMPTIDHGRMMISICTGSGPATVAMDVPGMEHHDRGDAAESGCAFADLALPAIGGADPVQLAEILAYVLALGLIIALTVPVAPAVRWRPPLRGPPATA